jgi:hypothetical protein
MMLELIAAETGSARRGDCCVTISGRLRRILIFKEAYEMMRGHHGSDFDCVQFWGDKEQPDRFWIKSATKELPGSTRIVVNPKNRTRTISVAHLLRFLAWGTEQSVRCPLAWDLENHGAVVIFASTEE